MLILINNYNFIFFHFFHFFSIFLSILDKSGPSCLCACQGGRKNFLFFSKELPFRRDDSGSLPHEVEEGPAAAAANEKGGPKAARKKERMEGTRRRVRIRGRLRRHA
ncbi:MAG TPA: hypothetical protein H9774_08505 [Candidatus Desulfovibrio gallistercoris]|nr:hypothetical protein [Candidatus Desulfovibrio gallistercoris]